MTVMFIIWLSLSFSLHLILSNSPSLFSNLYNKFWHDCNGGGWLAGGFMPLISKCRIIVLLICSQINHQKQEWEQVIAPYWVQTPCTAHVLSSFSHGQPRIEYFRPAFGYNKHWAEELAKSRLLLSYHPWSVLTAAMELILMRRYHRTSLASIQQVFLLFVHPTKWIRSRNLRNPK